MHKPLVSFAIPTYNRSAKLARLLKILYAQTECVAADAVEVLISDNCSTDDTRLVMDQYAPYGARLFRQTTNLDLDANLRFLYEQARGQYVWFFSDDDILLPGALRKVLDALASRSPDVLLFSFAQPPGLTRPTFDLRDDITVITDIRRIIEFVLFYYKLSIYVVSKQHKQVSPGCRVAPVNTLYDFLILALSALQRSPCPTLCILREQLASCDDEYYIIRGPPGVSASLWKVAEHPFIQEHYPDLKRMLRVRSMEEYTNFLLAIRAGVYKPHPDYLEAYQAAVRQLSFYRCIVYDTTALLKRSLDRLHLTGLCRNLLSLYRRLKAVGREGVRRRAWH